MVDKLLATLAAFIFAIISAGGYGVIVLLMAVESACIPLPSEIIMPSSGYLASIGRFDLIWVATAGALGCNLGSTVAYAVGAIGGRPFVDRFGRYVLISRRELDWVHSFFEHYGGVTVFVSRLLPVVRTFIALPAGVARMPMLKFQIYTFVGSWPWCYGLAYVGYRLGVAWNTDPTLRDVLHRFDAVIVAVMMAAAAWYVWRHLRREAK